MIQAYDEIGLLKPVKVNLFIGYRMYSAETSFLEMLLKLITGVGYFKQVCNKSKGVIINEEC
ncbi:hypothetical protein UT300018_32220 [Clostridium faecium]|uniref:hypothetical protein n=1 Tax=Clostridium faecium TaxID=2762223 RepID=UPI0017853F60|nr:hypothetical protein [Clostridium faecium]